MAFLNPAYLWAFLGLAIPIIIHFWSNKSGKTIKVGSIQFLKESESSQSRSIRLNEVALLLLRLSLLALLVIILAEPVWKKTVKKTPLTYLVEPSLIKQNTLKAMLDSLSETQSVKFLAEGFPEYDESFLEVEDQTPNYWQLAHQFEMLKSDSIIVFSKALINGVRGARPEINTKTAWHIFNDDSTLSDVMAAYQRKDTIEVFNIENHTEYVAISRIEIPQTSEQLKTHQSPDSINVTANNGEKSVPLFTQEPLQILIIDDGSTANPKRLLIDALKSIETYTKQPIDIEVVESYSNNSETIDLLIWNSTLPMPQSDHKQLTFKPNHLANSLIVKGSTTNSWYITAHLNSENVINQNFIEQLIELLDIKSEANTLLNDLDQRQVSQELIPPNYKNATKESRYQATLSVTKWLWLLFVPLLIIERIISKFRKQ